MSLQLAFNANQYLTIAAAEITVNDTHTVEKANIPLKPEIMGTKRETALLSCHVNVLLVNKVSIVTKLLKQEVSLETDLRESEKQQLKQLTKLSLKILSNTANI